MSKQLTWPAPANLHFPRAHACLLIIKEGDGHMRLYIQAIDAYARQRELSLNYNKRDKAWKLHVYLHPGVREISEVREDLVCRFMTRILYLASLYPTLLFNDTLFEDKVTPPQIRYSRCDGFVRLHDKFLLHKWEITANFMREFEE